MRIKIRLTEKIAYTFINKTFYILNIQGDLIKLEGFEEVNMMSKYIDPTHYGELWSISNELKIPLKVDIELTENCNLRCKCCFVEIHDSNEESKNLNKDKVFQLFDDLKEMGTLFITITGGECILHPDFLEILEYVLFKKFYIRVLTNGTTFDNNKFERFLSIINKGLVSVDVSLHSVNSNTFDNFVGNKNSFRKMEWFLNNISKADVPLNLKFNITNNNLKDLEKTKEYRKPEIVVASGIQVPIQICSFWCA